MSIPFKILFTCNFSYQFDQDPSRTWSDTFCVPSRFSPVSILGSVYRFVSFVAFLQSLSHLHFFSWLNSFGPPSGFPTLYRFFWAAIVVPCLEDN